MKKYKLVEWLKRGMYGIVPKYGENGENGTLILIKDSENQWDKRNIRCVVSELAAIHQKDIRLIRDLARYNTKQRSVNPLPVSENIFLVPFKMRIPVGKDDGAVGYIFLSAIKRIDESDGKTCVYFKHGGHIPVLDTVKTARNHYGLAIMMYADDCINSHFNEDTSYILNEGHSIYNKPVTKRDIIMFMGEFLKYVNK